jgi:peptidoglycan/xylan/chitin deacetylase (PgdA/CDA1 family)
MRWQFVPHDRTGGRGMNAPGESQATSHGSQRRRVRRRVGKAEVLILCYHAVSEDWNSTLSVAPRALESQLEFLASKGYAGVTFSDAALEDHPGKVVAVTFDDGYSSVGEIARPILDRFGFPGTVFVPTRFMGTNQPMSWPGIDQWIGGPHQNELMPMSWQDLRSLAEAGWEVGSHTVSHPRLTTLGDLDRRQELVQSREQCGRMIGATCRSIAFPYGDCDLRVIEAAREAGYSAVATIPWRLARSGRFVWPRTGVFHEDGQRVFRLKVSPILRRMRASRASVPLAPLVRFLRRGRGQEDAAV